MGAIKLDILNKSFRLQKVEDNFLNINKKACTGVYVFGFQGQEKDDEIANVTGSSYTATFWQYDSRLGRRWNLDPKPNPSISQYATFVNNPIMFIDEQGDTVKVTTGDGTYLFKLDNGKTELTVMTAHQVYKQGTQWFEPLADNYQPILDIAEDISTNSSLKHYSWSDIAKFATKDRWMISYRQGGSGDWKKEVADGYLLVTVDGKPYWGDAIGQIPFAVDKYTDEIANGANSTQAIQNTVQSGKEYGEGKLVGGETDNSNTYDNYMILKAAIWAKWQYTTNKDGEVIKRNSNVNTGAKTLRKTVGEKTAKKYGVKN